MILTCEVIKINMETRKKIKDVCKGLWPDSVELSADIVGYEKYPSGINSFYLSVLSHDGITTHSYNKWITI